MIPKEGTTEWAEEVEFYVTSSQGDRLKRAKKHGILMASYERRMRERGIRLGEKERTVVVESEDPIVNLPPIKLREYRHRKVARGSEEEAGLHLGDGHAGKVTPSFNGSVYQ